MPLAKAFAVVGQHFLPAPALWYAQWISKRLFSAPSSVRGYLVVHRHRSCHQLGGSFRSVWPGRLTVVNSSIQYGQIITLIWQCCGGFFYGLHGGG